MEVYEVMLAMFVSSRCWARRSDRRNGNRSYSSSSASNLHRYRNYLNYEVHIPLVETQWNFLYINM